VHPGTEPSEAVNPVDSVDEAVFRRTVARFPTGICIVTSRDAGIDHAMTVSSFSSVSLEPLLVLICVEVEARFHDAVISAGFWGVSILDGGGRAIADWLATRGRPLHGQLDQAPHHRGPATGVALLDAAAATLECRTEAVYPGGDHSIIVGSVASAAISASTESALVYHRGAYKRLD
jgi:flavin reductase (DIM6/NTAB) family NADH-FMN oxidoreductase RutF